MGDTSLEVIPAGRRFSAADIVHYRDKGVRPLEDVLAGIDLVVTGPHATGAFPEELVPFVDPGLTRRLQQDFSDCTTNPIAKLWAALDPHVLYIECPHPRAVRDANRPMPEDWEAALREAFRRVSADPGGRPSLAGVDATRPVTFAYLPVLTEPADDEGWGRLMGTLRDVATLGVDVYEQVRDDLIERIIEAKLARLTHLDPDSVTVADWRGATHLMVLSLHDTMNHTARPDGAVADERIPADRLPDIVALSNRGDAEGDTRTGPDGRSPVDDGALLSADAPTIRTLAEAHRRAFGATDHGQVQLNRPYLGGYETTARGAHLRAIASECAVNHAAAGRIALHLGAYQAEYRREFLLGEDAAAPMMQPGGDWPEPAEEHRELMAAAMFRAHTLFRAWGPTLDAEAPR